MRHTTTATRWGALNPSISRETSHARLQLHYAAQFATALGISYLAPHPDDSHTNLGWDRKLESLSSREVRALSHGVRVAIRPRDLALLVLIDGSIADQLPLNGSSISQIESDLRAALSSAGLDGRRFTLSRHYDLPTHPVAAGDPFDTSRAGDFDELARWYGNAAVMLEDVRSWIDGAEVRCWPHHFDIATITSVAPGQSCGAGMLPGDAMFPEPYYYVNAYPRPDEKYTSTALQGGGVWNTEDWFGAVLLGSRLSTDPAAQENQVRAFLESAIAACLTALRS